MINKIPNVNIEYQLLQLILSPSGGDKITVGLIHWDGFKLRYAFSPRTGKYLCLNKTRKLINLIDNSIIDLEKKAKKAAKKAVAEMFLSQVYFVRSGLGSILSWTKIIEQETKDPEAHFKELKNEFVELADE